MAETVTVTRGGTAEIKRASIDGVALSWGGGNTSPPKRLPAGKHYFYYVAKRTHNRTWRFQVRVVEGHNRTLCPVSGTVPEGGSISGECEFWIE